MINWNYMGYVLTLTTLLTIYTLFKHFEPASCEGFIAGMAILGASRAIWPHDVRS